jgi:peptidoglycan/xylan/chitin deacetylase (PgdA/CDA1 family)
MILLSFDVEEFDMPLEYGKEIDFAEQISISSEGTNRLLKLLKDEEVKATFFCTANFAVHAPEVIENIMSDGHEIASHGYFHSHFRVEDLVTSRTALEKMTGDKVYGFRMARMMPVDEKEVYNAGYTYNSSINPTWIPGRYNNLHKPRRMFFDQGILQIPASVSPVLRLPLFWLSFHNFPLRLYKYLCMRAYKADQYLNIYFHPWEFTDLSDERLGLPAFVRKNSGDSMLRRMQLLIRYFKKQNIPFGSINSFVENKKTNNSI